MRIFLSAVLAAITRGTAFFTRDSPGLSRTGTLRCISILAAADEAMGLIGWAASPVAGGGAGAASGELLGIVIFAPHVGHLISEPAPSPSTDSSWLQLGQLKMISIGRNGLMMRPD